MNDRHHNDGLRKMCGCVRSKWAKCEHPWHFNFRWDDNDFRFSLERVIGRLVRKPSKRQGPSGQRKMVWAPDPKSLGRPIAGRAEAKAEADRLRTEIRAGRLGKDGQILASLTVAQLLDTYEDRYVKVERAESLEHAQLQKSVIARTPIARPDGQLRSLGEWLVADVTTDTIDRFKETRMQRSTRVDDNEQTRIVGGVAAANRDLAFLRAAFNWAIRVGYTERTPFKRGSEAVVKLAKETPRSRRLEADEADRLLAACNPQLRAIVEAALATGCRLGELLTLQWHQVRLQGKPEIFLPAKKTKTKRDRWIPISSRLKKFLEMRASDPAGEPMPAHAYVFGNELGERVMSIKRAWQGACRRALITDLHFHDLRREAGSRWLDAGVPLQTVKMWLGHSNIAQTSTYLACTFDGQHEAMRRFDEHLDRLQPVCNGSAQKPIETPSDPANEVNRSHEKTPENTELRH